MKRIILWAVVAVSLTGCGVMHRMFAGFSDYSIICVEETHVQYVQFTSGSAVLVDQAGKPVPCK